MKAPLTCWAAQLLQTLTSAWNCSKGRPCPGSTRTLGPRGAVAQLCVVRDGRTVDDLPTLDDARQRLRRALVSLPWEGLKLSHGEPAIPTVFV